MINTLLKAALLPLYLELYDQSFPEIRPRIDSFLSLVISRLESKGLTITRLPVCRIKEEFDRAVNKAESEEVHAIITLHLAYSPSLESAEALKKTELPLIVMDTTPAYSFSQEQSPEEIMYNHGIHGVQDMCNLLNRNKKHFVIETGHIDHSDIVYRITHHVMSAKMLSAMKRGRTGLIGQPFKGMGDFSIDPEKLKKTIGTTTYQVNTFDVGKYMPDDNDPIIEEEMKTDAIRFDIKDVDFGLYRLSILNGLALRQWVKVKKLTAFTLNFSEITSSSGLSVMPFLEISKLLSNGIGYAGEGDVLTASFIRALFSVFEDVTFTEMFCPDWESQSIYLSHMGEINLNLTAAKPELINMSWNFTSATAPVFATGCYKEGRGILANLAPAPDNSYSLILAPVTLLPESDKTQFKKNIRGWMKPDMSLTGFLKTYSQLGGTHHSALIYTETTDILKEFGEMMGWNVHILE